MAGENNQAGERDDSGDHQKEFKMRRETGKHLPCLRIFCSLNDDRVGEGEWLGHLIAVTNAHEWGLSSHRPTRTVARLTSLAVRRFRRPLALRDAAG